MTALSAFLGSGTAARLALTLAHFTWQGAALAVALAVALRALRGAAASRRYWVACATLAAMVLCPVATFVLAPGTDGGDSAWSARVAGAGGAIVGAWVAGVFVLSARLLGGWLAVQKLRFRGSVPVDPALRREVSALAGAMGVRQRIGLLASRRVDTPVVIGWVSPVILVPLTLLSGLAPAQLRMLLAHELAHIRRYDYLVNLVQTGIETLLFFHPAVWWVSRRIRAEREHCCDDLAVASCGDATDYAEALMELETIRAGAPAMAPSAAGGDLIGRIARLLEGRDTEQSSRAWLAIVAMLAVCTAATLPVQIVPAGGPGDDSTAAVAGRAEPRVSWDISLPSAYEMGGAVGTVLAWMIGLALAIDLVRGVRRVRASAVYCAAAAGT
ncbi:MAG: M56 family metallopeptidase [Planctomycetota bacterium]